MNREGNGLRILYTNADQFINKKDFLIMHIAGNESDLIFITEVIPKAQVLPIAPALLSIPGFVLFTNFDPALPRLGASGTQGVCILARDSLHAAEIRFHNHDNVEHLWVQLRLKGNDKLIVGCVY